MCKKQTNKKNDIISLKLILYHLLVSGLLKGAVGTTPITSLTVRTFRCADSVEYEE